LDNAQHEMTPRDRARARWSRVRALLRRRRWIIHRGLAHAAYQLRRHGYRAVLVRRASR